MEEAVRVTQMQQFVAQARALKAGQTEAFAPQNGETPEEFRVQLLKALVSEAGDCRWYTHCFQNRVVVSWMPKVNGSLPSSMSKPQQNGNHHNHRSWGDIVERLAPSQIGEPSYLPLPQGESIKAYSSALSATLFQNKLTRQWRWTVSADGSDRVCVIKKELKRDPDSDEEIITRALLLKPDQTIKYMAKGNLHEYKFRIEKLLGEDNRTSEMKWKLGTFPAGNAVVLTRLADFPWEHQETAPAKIPDTHVEQKNGKGPYDAVIADLHNRLHVLEDESAKLRGAIVVLESLRDKTEAKC